MTGIVETTRDAAKALAKFLADDARGGEVLIEDYHLLVTAMGQLNSAASRIEEIEAAHDAARENFHTMQHAANALRIRAEAAEARIATLTEALVSERERCAEVAEDHAVIAAEMARSGMYAGPASAAKNTGIGIAAAIRALPPTKQGERT